MASAVPTISRGSGDDVHVPPARLALLPPNRTRAGSDRGPTGRTVSRAVALAVAIVGVGGALFVAHGVKGQTPYTQTGPARIMPRPVNARIALRDVLHFAPSGTGSTGLIILPGATMLAALQQATGPAKALATAGPAAFAYTHAKVVRLKSGAYNVSLIVPVQLGYLQHQGYLVGPGTDLQRGDLRVSLDGREVYAIDMNPKTHRATFAFQLSPNGQTLTSLNWNAMALVTQTDESDSLGF